MRARSIVAVLLGLVATALVILAALAPGSKTITVLPSVDLEDVDSVGPNSAVVIAKYELGGSSILGFTISRPDHLVRVQFFEEPGCSSVVSSGEPWPPSNEECRSAVPINGEISATGIASTGESIIGIEVEVSDACYDTVTLGESWPSTAPECPPTQ